MCTGYTVLKVYTVCTVLQFVHCVQYVQCEQCVQCVHCVQCVQYTLRAATTDHLYSSLDTLHINLLLGGGGRARETVPSLTLDMGKKIVSVQTQ